MSDDQKTLAISRMKRSRTLQVTSLMATASFSLAACGDAPSAPAQVEWIVTDSGARLFVVESAQLRVSSGVDELPAEVRPPVLVIDEGALATIEEAGASVDDATLDAMTQWLQADAAHHAQSTHRYTAEDFGLSAEGLQHDFSRYIARHLRTPRAA